MKIKALKLTKFIAGLNKKHGDIFTSERSKLTVFDCYDIVGKHEDYTYVFVTIKVFADGTFAVDSHDFSFRTENTTILLKFVRLAIELNKEAIQYFRQQRGI